MSKKKNMFGADGFFTFFKIFFFYTLLEHTKTKNVPPLYEHDCKRSLSTTHLYLEWTHSGLLGSHMALEWALPDVEWGLLDIE